MHNQPAPTDALIEAISAARNQIAEGWMALLQKSPPPATVMPQLGMNPTTFVAQQNAYLQQQALLWASLLAGGKQSVAAPDPGDRRFTARDWRENAYYDYLRQSYLLASRFVNELVESAPLDAATKERMRFASKQWLDAMCPANFAATNPQVIRKALETKGESLVRGMANLIVDSRKARISQTDESVFEVGRNLAVTPGAVVHENELMQLIQYAPSTPKVGSIPLVMVPPCINKYYILDLQPENSFVRYAVAQGHTVFMVSWRNVTEEQGSFGWDDYLQLGLFEPFRVAREITRAGKVNALGFCVGGTLLGAALAVLAERKEDTIGSVTYLTTMLDFAEGGQLGFFIDEQSVALREATIGSKGILPGRDLAFVFSALRANDLIWPYVVNNYLMGGSPAAFDLLYWNADSTNLPGPMYCTYIRNTYLQNRLREPGAFSCCGVAVDLRKVARPTFVLATREDHIVPWRSAYRLLHLLGGEKRFVLGASGHVAGVVNPADKGKRSYWVGEPYPEDPDAWLASATEKPGSWWTEWAQWMDGYKGRVRKAPAAAGNKHYPVIEPAPGRYVKQRAA